MPTPKKVLAVIGQIYLTPEFLLQPDPGARIAEAQYLVVFILWKDCKLSPEEITRLFALTEEQVYTTIGKATVSLENKDESFGQALTLVRSKL